MGGDTPGASAACMPVFGLLTCWSCGCSERLPRVADILCGLCCAHRTAAGALAAVGPTAPQLAAGTAGRVYNFVWFTLDASGPDPGGPTRFGLGLRGRSGLPSAGGCSTCWPAGGAMLTAGVGYGSVMPREAAAG